MKPGHILFLAAALAGSLSAATYTVSQDGRGAYGSIQAAVDHAKPYDEIVILDSAVYNEQVTLRSPLHHIVLRSADPSSPIRPVIRWSDQVNVGPKTCAEGLDTGKITFDKNGALRLMDVRDVRIEGIAVDGAGPMPFVNQNVWGNGKDCSGVLYPLFLGNDAFLVYRSSRVAVIGCEFRNAYFGAYVKDDDRAGPFASRGSSATPPFSHISSGNHFFEGNSIHHNTWGIFMESAWGLGTTFRDNLIYENHHASAAAEAAVKAMSSEGANQPSGAFFFKDVQYGSMTLQNNTFWHDYTLLAGGYRPGAQHLVVNNIFAEPTHAWTSDPYFPNSFMELSAYMPKRMKCNAFAGQAEIPALDSLHVTAGVFDTVTQQQVSAGKMVYSSAAVRIMNGFPSLKADTSSTVIDVPLSNGVKPVRTPLRSAIYMGTILQDDASSSTGFAAADQNRWVETRFKSLQPADPDFLMPVPEFREALGSGWDPLRYPDASGTPSAPGALPAAARPQALVRIVPLAPVLIENGRMVLRFTVQAVKGGPPPNAAAPVIAYLRLEKNVPADPLSFGGSASLRLPEAEAIPVPAAPIRFGYNEVALPPSGLSADSNALGFVEMAVQGMGTLSNVAQFPILPLASLFTVEALDETQDIPASGIAIGKTFRLRIAYAKTPAAIGPIRISLASGAALKFMNPADLDSAGNLASSLPLTAPAQFTETPDDGVELIWVSAYRDSSQSVTGFGQSRALVFDGTPTFMDIGKGRAKIKPADILKGRNVLGRKIGVKVP